MTPAWAAQVRADLKDLFLPSARLGAMMLGYPKFLYNRLPERKAPSITWR